MPDASPGIHYKGLLFSALSLFAVACTDHTDNLADAIQPPSVAFLGSPIDAGAIGAQNLLSFDIYADGVTLHALFAASTADSSRHYLGYLRSTDGGQHWSAPKEIGNYFPGKLESRIGNDVQIAASGNRILAVWQVSGEIPGMGPLVTLSSSDGGQSWMRGINPTGSDTDQSHADLAADSQGRFHLVWLDDRDENGYQGLRYARSSDAGLNWELAQTVDDSSCSCCWNRIVVSPDDRIHVLYRDMDPRDMALAQSADGGQTWRRTATVGNFNWKFDGCPHNGGGLAFAGGEKWHSLVWTGADNQVGLYHLQSYDNGQNWTPPRAMASGQPAFHSDIATGNDGALLASWDVLGDKNTSLVASLSTDDGQQWSVPQVLSAEGSSASFPRLVASASGWLALWLEQPAGGNKQWRSALIKKQTP